MITTKAASQKKIKKLKKTPKIFWEFGEKT